MTITLGNLGRGRRGRRIFDVQGKRRRDIAQVRNVGPHGKTQRLVIKSEACSTPTVVSALTPGLSVAPGTRTLIASPQGSSAATELASAPPGLGGSFPAEREETETTLGTASAIRRYLSIFKDPTNTDQVHIADYLDGEFQSILQSFDFADGESADFLATAIPIKSLNIVAFVKSTVAPAPLSLRLATIEVDTGVATNAVTPGLATAAVQGALRTDGAQLWASCFRSDNSTAPLFRHFVPSLAAGAEVARLTQPIGKSYRIPGVFMGTQVRIPVFLGASWDSIDHILYTGTTGTTGDTITADTASGSSPVWISGAETATAGYFTWSTGSGTQVKVGSLPSSGDGADLSWPATWLDDRILLLRPGAHLDTTGTLATFYRIRTAEQAAGVRFATVDWDPALPPATLPAPTDIDYTSAATALGFGTPEDAVPQAWIPWF